MSHPKSTQGQYADAYSAGLSDVYGGLLDTLTGGPVINAWDALQARKQELAQAGVRDYFSDPAYRELMFEVGESAPMLDSGLLASTVGKTVGSVATAFDRATSYADAVKLANQRAHLKRDTTGQYVGAPRDPTGRYPTVDSPQKLAAMRQ